MAFVLLIGVLGATFVLLLFNRNNFKISAASG